MRLLLTLTVAALLGGCGDAEPAKPKVTRKQRIEAAEIELGKTPPARTYRYADGELRVLEVPVKDITGDIERQRCFVWRDAEFRTAAVSCGQMPEVVLPSPN
jgi:hypothetical protein